MKERILAYCQMKGITPNAFETKAGWSPSTIYNLKKGVRSDKLADAALAFPDLDVRWLLTGQGNPIYETSSCRKEINGVSSPSVKVENVQAVFITNWTDIQCVVENAVNKALEGKK